MTRRRGLGGGSGRSLFGDAHTLRAAHFEPRVVAGIDEAGLGPMLGPLAIGCSAFRIEDDARDLWERLGPACARGIERHGERLVVADSKIVFDRTARGAERIERTVLAFDALQRPTARVARDAREFLASTPRDLRCATLESEPWFQHLGARLARGCTDERLAGAVALLASSLAEARVSIATLGVRAVPPTELNASFARTANKGASHWHEASRWLAHLWGSFAVEGLEVVVDRLGGRMRYASLLRALFPEATVDVVRELPAISEYALADAQGRRMRVVFAEKGESLSFAVALASCFAKYAREVCVAAFNAYFGALQPGLAPTAGYVTDARRWLEEARAAIERSGLETRSLVRSR